ncbi:hypothetical protein GQR58_021332 [Nymphon striatum]|nr:hypothetical protein GQR58_021332 [Nymphon striatum]
MYDEECWKITENVVEEAPQLFTYQEEAGTRMFLLVKDAEARGYERVVIVSEDTYVLSAFEAKFLPNMTVYQERETQARSRYVKISAFGRKGKLKAWKWSNGIRSIKKRNLDVQKRLYIAFKVRQHALEFSFNLLHCTVGHRIQPQVCRRCSPALGVPSGASTYG